MQKARILGLKAFEYHQSGFHCAEAVSMTIVEAYDRTGRDVGLPMAATLKCAV